MMDASQLRSFILSIVKPLKSGKLVKQDKLKATMDNLYPDGFSENFKLTSPFGFIANIPKGVTGFYQSLFGSGHETIILNQLHDLRPNPLSAGDVVVYCTDQGGASFPVLLYLGSDGKLTITTSADTVLNCVNSVVNASGDVTVNCNNANINASAKTKINSPSVEIGSGALEKIINGEIFKTLFDSHVHIGNIGYPTSAPTTPLPESALSAIVKAAK
jgi:hypothetical protein